MLEEMQDSEDLFEEKIEENIEKEKQINEEKIKNLKLLVIQDGRLFTANDLNEKFVKKITYDYETYKIENNEFLIIDLDKNSIKNYVKYLIKGMEGSRELGAIYFWNTLIIICLILSLLSMWFTSSRPTIEEIKKELNMNNTKVYTNAPISTPINIPKSNTWIIIK